MKLWTIDKFWFYFRRQWTSPVTSYLISHYSEASSRSIDSHFFFICTILNFNLIVVLHCHISFNSKFPSVSQQFPFLLPVCQCLSPLPEETSLCRVFKAWWPGRSMSALIMADLYLPLSSPRLGATFHSYPVFTPEQRELEGGRNSFRHWKDMELAWSKFRLSA